MIIIEPYGSHLKPKYDFGFWALVGLLSAHFVTSYIWFKEQAWTLFSTENFESYCGFLYKNCTSIAAEDTSSFQFLFILYALISIFGLALLLARKVKIVNWIFIALFIFKLLFLVSRFNFVNSYHEVHLILCLVYFLSRGVDLSYRVIFCLQHFLSGISKMSYSWFSGASLLTLYGFSPTNPIFTLVLSYIVALQVVLIWGLVVGSSFVRKITLVQILVLSLAASYFVGLEYALMNVCFISPLIISEFFLRTEEGVFRNFFESYILKQVGFGVLLVLLIFMTNIFSGKKNSFVKSGENKFLDINVLKKNKECRFRLIETTKDGTGTFTESKENKITSCEEASYQAYLRRLCNKNKNLNISFQVEEKIKKSQSFVEIERYANVCKNL